ncbi:hypothetical protein C8R47DRAFT_180031 [Mycena vitilis]|nr:hypothetical protein C8R47DRAFT_180031 [Mycena vitilis]
MKAVIFAICTLVRSIHCTSRAYSSWMPSVCRPRSTAVLVLGPALRDKLVSTDFHFRTSHSAGYGQQLSNRRSESLALSPGRNRNDTIQKPRVELGHHPATDE